LKIAARSPVRAVAIPRKTGYHAYIVRRAENKERGRKAMTAYRAAAVSHAPPAAIPAGLSRRRPPASRFMCSLSLRFSSPSPPHRNPRT
jgi:hypothetical protein